MALFTSAREKRLWITTFVVVAVIYSTIGVTGVLAGWLRLHGLLETTFVLGFAAVMMTIVFYGMRQPRKRREWWLLSGTFAVFVLLLTRMQIPEERTHLVEYGVVGILMYAALAERYRSGSRRFLPAALAIVLTMGVGLVDECIQGLVPSRTFDWRDVLFNSLAAFMSVSVSAMLGWARQDTGATGGDPAR